MLELRLGDCREIMRTLDEASVDAVVCDPPYELGFMSKKWDATGVAFDPATWRAALRVLKPGGYLLAFGGSRTYHRMACAIEDAGFEIRDQIGWVFASGFPKSRNVDKERGRAICGCESTSPERDMRSLFGTDVPAAEPAGEGGREVLQPSVPEPGASAAGWPQLSATEDGRVESGMEGRGDDLQEAWQLHRSPVREGAGVGVADGASRRIRDGAQAGDGSVVQLPPDKNGSGASRRPRSNAKPTLESGTLAGQQEPQARGAWPLCGGCGLPVLPRGLGTALKPAWEPICLARKPLVGTVVANVLAHGTGALNIDGCRVFPTGESVSRDHEDSDERSAVGVTSIAAAAGTFRGGDPAGRWPANLIHDGSDEVLAAFPDAPGQQGDLRAQDHAVPQGNAFGQYGPKLAHAARKDAGSAARFFYCTKSSKSDRGEDNTHPTVKPTDLMRYLCRLVTPPGGVVLDPFMGSGSTGKAAVAEGFSFIGCELNADYLRIAQARIVGAGASPVLKGTP